VDGALPPGRLRDGSMASIGASASGGSPFLPHRGMWCGSRLISRHAESSMAVNTLTLGVCGRLECNQHSCNAISFTVGNKLIQDLLTDLLGGQVQVVFARLALGFRQVHRRRNREMGQGHQVCEHQAGVTSEARPRTWARMSDTADRRIHGLTSNNYDDIYDELNEDKYDYCASSVDVHGSLIAE